MNQRLKILVMMDHLCINRDDPDFNKTAPDYNTHTRHVQSTEHYVVNALRDLGHTVDILGVDDKVQPIVEELSSNRPDLVFNLTENFRFDRRLDMNITALLELLDVPFTGTGAAGLLLCRDKALCKQVLGARKIRVPGFYLFHPGRTIRTSRQTRFPLVVKPLYEDGSDGISNGSLVKNPTELEERVRMVHDTFRQPAIAEEYIQGRELYITVLGNRRLSVLPARELFINSNGSGAPVLATSYVKWNESYQKKWKIQFGFSQIEPELQKRIERVCKRTYHLLHIRDYGRIDLRVTDEGAIYVIEANPNPGLACGDEVAESAAKAGLSYTGFISRLITTALRRHTFSN